MYGADSGIRSRIVRVFILGGTGSIGSPIVRELVKRGHDIWALALPEEALSILLPKNTLVTLAGQNAWHI